MSFRNTRNSKATPRRSSSLRNSHNTVPGLASYNRPRSLSFVDTPKSITPYNTYSPVSNTTSFHSLLGASNHYPSYNNYSAYNSYNPYSKNSYSNSYNLLKNNISNYGGLTSGYGSVSVPSTALTALNIMPYSTKSYDKSSRDYLQTVTPKNTISNVSSSDKTRKSRSSNRSGSYARSRSASGVRDSGMGSRSLSSSSINSEGYVVR